MSFDANFYMAVDWEIDVRKGGRRISYGRFVSRREKTMEAVCVETLKTQEDRLYHNTKKLLENYRLLRYIYITRVGKLDFELKKEANQSNCTVSELIDEAKKLSIEPFEGEDTLRRQIQWLEIAIQYLQKNIAILKEYPHKGNMYSKVISLRYLNPNEASISKISEELNISERTYWRVMQEAIKELDRLLWENLDEDLENHMLNIVNHTIINNQFIH